MERTAKIMAIAAPAWLSRADPGIDSKLSAGSREKLFRRPRDEMYHSAEWNYFADKIKRGERWTRGWT